MSRQARFSPYKKVEKKDDHDADCPRFDWRNASDALKAYWAAERDYIDDLRSVCMGDAPKQDSRTQRNLKAAIDKVKHIHQNLSTYCYFCQTFKTFIKFKHECDHIGLTNSPFRTKKLMKLEDIYYDTFIKDDKYKFFKADKEKEQKEKEEKEKETKNVDPDFRDEDLRQERFLNRETPPESPTGLGALKDSLPPIPSHITRSEESSCLSCSC